MNNSPSLRERKRQRARERIVEAAYELFAARGFGDVTVADIAGRAEVGRSTFFRYFGDKQEVVFADEQRLWDLALRRTNGTQQPTDLAAAVALLRPVVVGVCRDMTRDPDHYLAHERLIRRTPELYDRNLRKLMDFAAAMRDGLVERGAAPSDAALAAQLALACYAAARDTAGAAPERLAVTVAANFDQLATIGRPR
jgi:AcrR family transcriptional regulator